MQRCCTKVLLNMVVQYSNITEAAYPFRFLNEFCKIECINNAAHAVAAAAHEYGINGGVVEHGLQIRQALCICAGKIVIVGADGFAMFYLKAPMLQYLCCCF